jgi:hypothetical protein
MSHLPNCIFSLINNFVPSFILCNWEITVRVIESRLPGRWRRSGPPSNLLIRDDICRRKQYQNTSEEVVVF